MSQGNLLPTDKPLDVAIVAGIFKITLPDGRTPTRATARSRSPRRAHRQRATATSCSRPRHSRRMPRNLTSTRKASVVILPGDSASTTVGQDRALDFRQQVRPARRSAQSVSRNAGSGCAQNGTPVSTGRRSAAGKSRGRPRRSCEGNLRSDRRATRYEMNAKVIRRPTRCCSRPRRCCASA